MKSIHNFTILQNILKNHPEHSCSELQCIGTNSICVNILGYGTFGAEQCICEFPRYGTHCEYDETDLLEEYAKSHNHKGMKGNTSECQI